MDVRPPRRRTAKRLRLATLAALISPAILGAQVQTSLAATPNDIMSAASVAIATLKADSAQAFARVAQTEKDLRDAKAALDALKAALSSLQAKIDQVLSDIAKLEKEEKEELARVKDANSSLVMMRIVAVDRVAASKLLDAMKQRNASTLATLLDPTASPA